MEKTILLQDQAVHYTLRTTKRARRLRLAVYPGGACVVTVPHNINEKFVEDFIIQKSLWVITVLERMRQYAPRTTPMRTKKDFDMHKDRALMLVTDRVAYFNQIYKFRFSKISIKNQKTRWGSCSRKGNLSFNYKVVLLPPHLVDYIVVHELCHLGQLNHSKKFWELVRHTIPNAHNLRHELKKA